MTRLRFISEQKHIPLELRTDEKRQAFEAILIRSLNRDRKPLKLFPIIGKKPLDTYELFLQMECRGGYQKVMQDKLFKEVGQALDLSPSVTNAGWRLKVKFEQLIQPYIEILRKNIWPDSPGALIAKDAANWLKEQEIQPLSDASLTFSPQSTPPPFPSSASYSHVAPSLPIPSEPPIVTFQDLSPSPMDHSSFSSPSRDDRPTSIPALAPSQGSELHSIPISVLSSSIHPQQASEAFPMPFISNKRHSSSPLNAACHPSMHILGESQRRLHQLHAHSHHSHHSRQQTLPQRNLGYDSLPQFQDTMSFQPTYPPFYDPTVHDPTVSHQFYAHSSSSSPAISLSSSSASSSASSSLPIPIPTSSYIPTSPPLFPSPPQSSQSPRLCDTIPQKPSDEYIHRHQQYLEEEGEERKEEGEAVISGDKSCTKPVPVISPKKTSSTT
ncbi:hypothetical protein ADUPG1_013144, partial [Aduncisulcus paluster]